MDSARVKLQKLRKLPEYNIMDSGLSSSQSSNINNSDSLPGVSNMNMMRSTSSSMTLQPEGDGRPGYNSKTPYYERSTPVATCSKQRAIIITGAVLLTLILCSVIIAFVRPITECTPAEEEDDFFSQEPTPKPWEPPIATNGDPFPWDNIRLPDTLSPSKYSILVHPNLTTMHLKGQMEIVFSVTSAQDFVVLHANNLVLTDTLVRDSHGKEILSRKLLYFPPRQQVYLELRSNLEPGQNYSLGIRYEGKIGTNLEGIYLSNYRTPDGQIRYLATTHFEPTYARWAFPCFDEPQFKARFKLSIIRQKELMALSNMPLDYTEDVGFYLGAGLVQDHFKESLTMSTYLVAFVVSDFGSISNQSQRGVAVSVFAPKHLLPQATFALDVATQLLDYYEDFFGVPYPLPKLDLIAIPDFAAGAMENWGLITYRETCILIDPNQASAKAKQWIAVVVAHELAHQWFGNLVTMRWWNDLWLNEGFASLVENLGVQKLFPTWKLMDQFLVGKTQVALTLDALSTSHPISLPVEDPRDIEAIFDTISYNKGAALLYMMQRMLGEEVFKKGLTFYLTRHKYGNTITDDLWVALTLAARNSSRSIDVKTVMDSWNRQMGFPVLNVKREPRKLAIYQEQFFLTPPTVTPKKAPSASAEASEDTVPLPKWYVPVSYVTSDNPSKELHSWMFNFNATLDVPDTAKWVKMNLNQTGYYRVNYDLNTWLALVKVLQENHTIFTPADRANLLDDAFTLSRAGMLNVTIPLSMALYLVNETEYVPWTTALTHFRLWDSILALRPARRAWHCLVRTLLRPSYIELGWQAPQSHVHRLLQVNILDAAVHFGIEDAILNAKRLFQEWMLQNKPVNPDLQNTVYSAGIKYGSIKEWDYCFAQWNKTAVPSEKIILLKALAQANEPWILQQYLDYSLDKDIIRPQDFRVVIESVSQNPLGSWLVWRQMKTRWNDIQDMFGSGSFTMSSLVTMSTSKFTTPLELKEVEIFFKSKDVGSGRRSLQQSLETVRSNVQFLERHESSLEKWLASHAPC